MTLPNPDPLRPTETDQLFPSAQYVAGYDDGFHDGERRNTPLLQATAFGCGLIVGMIVAVVLVMAAGVR